jgi:hypothetical protein
VSQGACPRRMAGGASPIFHRQSVHLNASQPELVYAVTHPFMPLTFLFGEVRPPLEQSPMDLYHVATCYDGVLWRDNDDTSTTPVLLAAQCRRQLQCCCRSRHQCRHHHRFSPTAAYNSTWEEELGARESWVRGEVDLACARRGSEGTCGI